MFAPPPSFFSETKQYIILAVIGCSVVSLAQVISPSVALPAKLNYPKIKQQDHQGQHQAQL